MTAAEAPAGEPDRAPLDLGRRIEDAYRALAYLAVGVPVGVVCALAVVGVLAGGLLSLVWIGLPLLAGALVACRELADIDRRQANRLLRAHVMPLPPRRRGALGGAGGPWRSARRALADRHAWRMIAFCALKLPLALALLIAGVLPIALTAALLVLGAQSVASAGDAEFLGPWRLGPPLGVVLLALAAPAAIVAIAVLDGLGVLARRVVRAVLVPRGAGDGPVREMLAESIGDRTLSVAYWLPDRQVFVDEGGRPVELPAPGSGRAWTAVERDGRRVAAIVHDAELDTGPELVNAAAAGAALALDNERLKADLRARVEELRESRVRIVEAADTARRRLERDLHDGAQQQLVSLALDLRLLKARLRGTEHEPAVDELTDKLGVALADLRELARGIHPAILTDRGLGPAIEALADRVPVPVDVDVELDERLTPAIEAGAYFLVAEALTNVAKYANATSARVAIRRDGPDLTVAVDDDGAGGASPDRGSGLRGLQDRIAALDGRLRIDSPPGGGTHLRARIPCAARKLVIEAHERSLPTPTEPALEPRP